MQWRRRRGRGQNPAILHDQTSRNAAAASKMRGDRASPTRISSTAARRVLAHVSVFRV